MSDLDEKRAEAIGKTLAEIIVAEFGDAAWRLMWADTVALRDADTAAIVAEGGRILTAEQWATVGTFVRYFEDYDIAVTILGQERSIILAALDGES